MNPQESQPSPEETPTTTPQPTSDSVTPETPATEASPAIEVTHEPAPSFEGINPFGSSESDTVSSPESSDAETLKAVDELETKAAAEPQPAVSTPETIQEAPVTTIAPTEENTPPVSSELLSTSSSTTPDTAAPANEPATTPIAPVSAPKKKSRALLIVLLFIVLVVAGAIAGYFIWKSMQPATSTTAEVSPTSSKTASTSKTAPIAQTAPAVDTASSVTSDVGSIQSDLSNLNDTDYSDSSLSDQTLYN